MNDSANVHVEPEVARAYDRPGEADESDDPRDRDVEAEDSTPEEAGYGYGV